MEYGNQWAAPRLQLFDGNGDGVLDREERTAAGYFERVLKLSDINQLKKDWEFLIVEKAIALSKP